MKKIVFAITVLLCSILCGCGTYERFEKDRARGNDINNVEAAKEISNIEGVSTVSVLSQGKTVLAGIRIVGGNNGKKVCDCTVKLLKKWFPEADVYIVGANEPWAEDIIELNLYAESGMDRKILKKRFEFLVNEKLKMAQE